MRSAGALSLPQEIVPASVPELLRPERLSELPAGRLQRASLLLLHASALNRADVVRLLLRTVRISPNVADADGVSALVCAAVSLTVGWGGGGMGGGWDGMEWDGMAWV